MRDRQKEMDRPHVPTTGVIESEDTIQTCALSIPNDVLLITGSFVLRKETRSVNVWMPIATPCITAALIPLEFSR
jgi:hypothetical protein